MYIMYYNMAIYLQSTMFISTGLCVAKLLQAWLSIPSKMLPKLYGYLSSVDKLITSARRHASPLAHLCVAQLLQMRRLGSQARHCS